MERDRNEREYIPEHHQQRGKEEEEERKMHLHRPITIKIDCHVLGLRRLEVEQRREERGR